MSRKSSKSRRAARRKDLPDSMQPLSSSIVPSTLSLRNSQKCRFTLTTLLTGANFTPATTVGYAYRTITSNDFSLASGYAELAALFSLVRPLGCKATVTFNRATGNNDNPRVAFIPSPAGFGAGNLAMNLNTLEAATGRGYTCGPGERVIGYYKPYVSIAAYNTLANGYVTMPAGTLSLASMPIVYFGDVLLSTPSVNVTSVTAYVSLHIEFDFEFSVLRPTLVA
jgi:hypothetical protein